MRIWTRGRKLWFSIVTMCLLLFKKNNVLWFPSFPFCSFPLGVHMQYCHSLYLYNVEIFLHTGDVNTFASIGTFLHQVFPVLCFGHTDIWRMGVTWRKQLLINLMKLYKKSPKSSYKQKWNEEGRNRWDNKWSEDRKARYVRHFVSRAAI